MIAKYNGLADTGVYTQMLLLISAVLFPYRSVIRVSSPLISKQWKDRNKSGMATLYQKSSSIGLILGLLGFLFIWIPIQELFSFIPAYVSGINVFFFLMIGRIVDMYFGLNGIILSTSKKYKADFAFTLLLIICVYVFNLYLIPKYGILGASISTGFAYVLYNVLRGWYLFKVYQLSPYQGKQLKLLFTFGIFLVLYYTLAHFTMNFYFIQSVLLKMCLKEILLFIGFILPVYWLNLEPESVGFVKNWIAKRKKLNTNA